MADNVDITSGSGTTIATDQVQVGGTNATAHVQFTKLVDGTLNGTDPISGNLANGLDVDVTRLPTAISTQNSTTSPLSSGATFTGTYEDVSSYANISVTVDTDDIA